jgi:hypothetical protein
MAGSIREHDRVEVDHAAFALVAQSLCYLLAELYYTIFDQLLSYIEDGLMSLIQLTFLANCVGPKRG